MLNMHPRLCLGETLIELLGSLICVHQFMSMSLCVTKAVQYTTAMWVEI